MPSKLSLAAVLGGLLMSGDVAAAANVSCLDVTRGFGPGTTCVTVSTAEIDTIVTTPLTQTVNNYSLELIGRMQGGSVLFDQTFNVPFGNALFQAGMVQADGALTSAGGVSFLGPTLLSNSQSLMSSVPNSVQTGRSLTNAIMGTELFIGPKTILHGDFGVCTSYALDAANHATPSGCSLVPSCFAVDAGATDFDTFTISLINLLQTSTTTNTFLSTQVYEIDGLRGPAPAVPEPASFGLIGVGLAEIAALKRRST